MLHNVFCSIMGANTGIEGDEMEKGLDMYVKRLIELDSKALELKGRRESEVAELEMKYRNELKAFSGIIKDASALSKKKHQEIIDEAKRQAGELEKATTEKLATLKRQYVSFRDEAAKAIWEQLLKVER